MALYSVSQALVRDNHKRSIYSNYYFFPIATNHLLNMRACIIFLPYAFYIVVIAEHMMGAAMYELVRVGHQKLVCMK